MDSEQRPRATLCGPRQSRREGTEAPRGRESSGGKRVRLGSATLGSFRSESGLGNVFVSAQYAETLGIPREGALGPGWLDAVHPDDRGSVESAVEQAHRDGVAFDIEFRFHRPDGTERRARLCATPQVGDGGAEAALVGALEDVTERREADERARRITVAADATTDLLSLHDHTGRVVHLNAAARAFYGIGERDPLPEMYLPDMTDPPAEGAAAVYGALERDGQWQGTLPMVASDGRAITASITITAHRDDAGRVEYFTGVARDVTDLTQVADRFAALVELSSDHTVVIDDSGRLLYVSPAAAKFLGRPAEALVGRMSPEPHPDDAERVLAVLAEVEGEPGSVRKVEYRQQRSDGAWRHIAVVMTNLLDTPSVGGVVLNIRDVTERVESEGLLRALIMNTSDIITVAESDGTIRYSSPASERLLGYVEGASPGLTIFDIIHPDDLDAVRSLWNERLDAPGFVRPIEVRLLKADGTWLEAETIANNLLDDPTVGGIVLATRDISERKTAERALRGRDERLRALVENLTEAIVVLGADGKVLFQTPSTAEIFGEPTVDRAGMSLWNRLDRLHPDDLEPATAALAAAFAEPGTHDLIDARIRHHKDGHWVRIEALVQNLLDDPSMGSIIVTLRDITERRHAEDLVAGESEVLRLVATGTPLKESLEHIARLAEYGDPALRCVTCTVAEGGSALHPAAAPSLPDSLVTSMKCSRDDAGGCPRDPAIDEPGTITVSRIGPEGEWHPSLQSLFEHGLHSRWSTPLVAPGSGEMLGMLSLFTSGPGHPSPAEEQRIATAAHLASIAIERKRYEERLLHQSLHDSLTALPNRVLFRDRLTHALERRHRSHTEVAVLFLDLDRFKLVNDSLGHDAGDGVLASIAQRLMSAVRPGDTVARFAGDEFVVLCEDLPAASAGESTVEIAQRLQSAISEPCDVKGTEVFLSASVGIAATHDADVLPDDLLRDADVAMYHAKTLGTGRCEVFDRAMRERVLMRSETEQALHQAIEREELRLFYQPIISIAEQRCVGAEALVRWQHPERGLVLPGEFIGLAEESGLIHDLGCWVLREAAAQMSRWQVRAPDDFIVSVNISARQLAQGDLHEVVGKTLQATGARPNRLCLEITESILMDDTASAVDLIEQVRELGVLFSIDDFGTGYSSLGYLKNLPVDTVKVDRSFVSTMTSDPEDAAIVSAVIGLAHALNLQVVAEGVETAEQLSALADLGCDHAQGFYFSPPQPAADLRRIFARNRWRVPDTLRQRLRRTLRVQG